MAGLSNADIARGNGYSLQKGTPINNSEDLIQTVAVVAEVNHANQSVSTAPVLITSRQQAALLYGWGSPMDIIMRILFPASGGGIGANPVWAYPVLEAGGAAANVQTLTVTGTATANVTHNVLIGGRPGLEGGSYAINIVVGDTPTTTGVKIFNAINAALGCPMVATKSAGVVTLTANWYGVSSEDITVHVLTNGNPGGMSYAVAEGTGGTGISGTLATTLAQFSNQWNTQVLSGWGILNTTANAAWIAFNGSANTQTGRFDPLSFKPAIYISGNATDSTTSSADTVITAALLNEMTIAVAPAPLSLGLPMEAAANKVLNFVNSCANNPNISDDQGIPYPDMPGILPGGATPSQSANYTLRNALVGMGMSTVIYNAGQYIPQDFVTTYAPLGETPPAFRYPRDIMIDMQVAFKFKNLRKAAIEGKQIANDEDQVTATNVVKPKDIKADLIKLATDLVDQGFTTNAAFMIASITVVINPSNVDRFDIAFSYRRSGLTRVISNVATAYP